MLYASRGIRLLWTMTILVVAISSFGCGAHARVETRGETLPVSREPVEISFVGACEYVEPGVPDTGDPLEIRGVELTEDGLYILVRHGGGCEIHEYSLCSAAEAGAAEVKISYLHVRHDAKGDRCKALINTVLRISRDDLPTFVGLHGQEEEITEIGIVLDR